MTKKPRQKSGTYAGRIKSERGASGAEPPGRSVPSGPETDDDDLKFSDGFLTPEDMREWAQIEMRQVAKELDLRARELLDLTTRYSAGEITPEKADELQSRYYHRWGLALPGAVPPRGPNDPQLSDKKILAQMDKHNKEPFITSREAWENYAAGRKKPGSGQSH